VKYSVVTGITSAKVFGFADMENKVMTNPESSFRLVSVPKKLKQKVHTLVKRVIHHNKYFTDHERGVESMP
jgi:hypothetical protein